MSNNLNQKMMLYNEFVKNGPVVEESDILKSSFLANMSHEVRTQLNGILGIAQMIHQSKEVSFDIRNDVKMIVESGNSLLALFDNIVDMMKIEEKQVKINRKPFFLNKLMDEIFSMFLVHPVYKQKNAGYKNIILKYDKPDKNIAIMGDPDRLKQILASLVDNALKFTEKGYIYYGYSVKNGEIIFYVMDSGIGIPTDKKKKIFNWFAQEDNILSRKYGGVGLGLAISKGLVSLMNGKMWCASNVEKGSNFYFTIPYHPANLMSVADTSPKKKILDKDWSNYTVLIVEDDVINHKMLKAMLRNTNVKIIHVDNGQKAIEEVRLNPQIDLTLMNMQLSEMNSLETAGKILGINPSIPVIAQTTKINSHECLEIGCVDYISKPTNMGELFTKMSKFLPDQSFNLMSN